MEQILVSLVIIWIVFCVLRGRARLEAGLPDKDYEAESRLHHRAVYLAGKNLGKSITVGTKKRKLHRVK